MWAHQQHLSIPLRSACPASLRHPYQRKEGHWGWGGAGTELTSHLEILSNKRAGIWHKEAMVGAPIKSDLELMALLDDKNPFLPGEKTGGNTHGVGINTARWLWNWASMYSSRQAPAPLLLPLPAAGVWNPECLGRRLLRTIWIQVISGLVAGTQTDICGLWVWTKNNKPDPASLCC